MRGVVRTEADVGWIDPLASLPDPTDDLTLFRTFPGSPERGRVTWSERGPGEWAFETTLPHRFDAQGCTRRGAWVNGGWFPQPVLAGDPLPPVRWSVHVRAEGHTIVVGEHAGPTEVSWTGIAERVPVAVLVHARINTIAAEGWTVTVVEDGAHRRGFTRELTRIAEYLGPRPAVVVEAPLRRRLVRPGPGVLFASDRAFRLTPGLLGVHRLGVARGFLAAGLRGTDGWLRELGAAAALPELRRQVRAIDAAATLSRIKWIPEIDALLSNRRLPFYADVLGEHVPGDPLADDLGERLRPSVPPGQVAAQLGDRFGEGRRRAVAGLIAAGASDETIEQEAGLPAGWLASWRVRPVPEDYTLRVETGDASRVVVVREAPPGTYDETIVVAIDGARLTRTGPPGEFAFGLPSDPRKVSLDPDRHLAQTSRLGDDWPPRYTTTFAAGIDAINLTRGTFSASAWGGLRRTGDTHNTFNASIGHNDINLATVRVGWTRREGPLLDGFARPHRFSVSTAVSLLDPTFSDAAGGQVALDGGLGYSTDDRVSWEFPLRGRRLYANVGGGGIPATGDRWSSTGAGATAILSPHPRHAFAGTVGGALAWSDVPHRLLELGGPAGLASIPDLPACETPDETGCQTLATRRALLAFEYRTAVIRGASVPAILAWGSELQLAFGVEGTLAQAGVPVTALGATFGVTGIYDLVGAQPSMFGATAGWPLAWDGLALEHTAVPEIYLRWSQAF